MNKAKQNEVVKDVLEKMRDLTSKENDSIQRYIDSISIDTGITFSDLEDDKKTLNINDISDKR